MEEARVIDTLKGGDWPLLMRSVALPLDDRMFFERSKHKEILGASILGKKLIERLDLIHMYQM
jgi:hypothetical protein